MGGHTTPLYYLGNIKEPVQVRVLTSTDGVGGIEGFCKEPPSANNQYWADTFNISSEDDYLNEFNTILSGHI